MSEIECIALNNKNKEKDLDFILEAIGYSKKQINYAKHVANFLEKDTKNE